jgi:hypothetical protein
MVVYPDKCMVEDTVKMHFKLLSSHFSKKSYVLLCFLFIFTIFQIGCETIELDSHWLDREIVVDGIGDDWLGAKYYFTDSHISVGLFNDESHLYFCMVAENPMIRAQLMRQGFTLWFDPKGEKDKVFGIRFPLGMQGGERPMGGLPREQDQEEMTKKFERTSTELEILGPGKDEVKKMAVKDAEGIEIELKASTGLIVYEIKIPLASSKENPYAVGAAAGDKIGVGLDSPKPQMKRSSGMRGMPGMGGRGGGSRGGGMGGMSGRRMPGGGMQPGMPKELKIWANVQLASDSNSQSESLL